MKNKDIFMADLHIEVAFAYPQRYFLKKLVIQENTTVEQAIEQSGVLKLYPEIDLQTNKIGVFARLVKLTDLLSDGDRIEIYRPLLADPKEIRRKRAEQQALKNSKN